MKLYVKKRRSKDPMNRNDSSIFFFGEPETGGKSIAASIGLEKILHNLSVKRIVS